MNNVEVMVLAVVLYMVICFIIGILIFTLPYQFTTGLVMLATVLLLPTAVVIFTHNEES